MIRLILCLLFLAAPMLSQGQPGQRRASNRYGQPIVNREGSWQPANADQLARFNDRLDTIPGYNTPYTYIAEKILPEELENYRTEIFTYKTYPDYELSLGIDMPKARTDDPTPVLFMIHGGGWRNGSFDAPNFVRQGRFFAGKGITVVRVGYTLADDGTIENSIADLQDAIEYITSRAEQFNIDPSRIGFTGISAGGHLSSYMAMTWPGTKALVAHCGPQDLSRMFGDRARQYLNSTGREEDRILLRYFLVDRGNAEGLAKYSPVNNIPQANKIPAVMLMHGDFDLIVPLNHTRQFADSLRAKGAEILEVRIARYGGHGFLNPNRDGYEEDMLAILHFLQNNL